MALLNLKTVNAPSASAGTEAVASGAAMLDKALRGFGDVARGVQEQRVADFERQRDINTQQVLAQLRNIQDPTTFAPETDILNRATARFGDAIDRERIIAARQAAPQELEQRQQFAFEAERNAQRRQFAPTLDQFGASIAAATSANELDNIRKSISASDLPSSLKTEVTGRLDTQLSNIVSTQKDREELRRMSDERYINDMTQSVESRQYFTAGELQSLREGPMSQRLGARKAIKARLTADPRITEQQAESMLKSVWKDEGVSIQDAVNDAINKSTIFTTDATGQNLDIKQPEDLQNQLVQSLSRYFSPTEINEARTAIEKATGISAWKDKKLRAEETLKVLRAKLTDPKYIVEYAKALNPESDWGTDDYTEILNSISDGLGKGIPPEALLPAVQRYVTDADDFNLTGMQSWIERYRVTGGQMDAGVAGARLTQEQTQNELDILERAIRTNQLPDTGIQP